MLRMYQSRDAQSARDYFTEALAREDYYTRDQETPGRWHGRGADMLGLRDRVVDRDSFARLVENQHPFTQEQLTARHKGDRTPGYDISFHAPKGVSVLQALGHTELQQAFEDSVRETMAEMEREMKTRVRAGGVHENRVSGNMAWAAFTHFTARPVDGEADPHLHIHCYTINATFDAEESRWKAGQFRDLKRDAPYFEAAFHNRLALKAAELGYSIERSARGWDIAGVPEAVKAEFSRRTTQIEKAAKDLGVTRPESKSQLGARTRESKGAPQTHAELVRGWDARLSDQDREALFAIVQNASANHGEVRTTEEAAREAMAYAVGHCFERVSVISEKRLCEAALRFGVGKVSIEDIKAQLNDPEFIRREFDGQAFVTTQEMHAEELAMIDLAREGRGRCSPFVALPEDAALPGEKIYAMQNPQLSAEQRGAVAHVLGSFDRVTAIRGAAGVGKTTLMKEVAEGIRFGGKEVFAFASGSETVQDVLQAEGFRASTVAMLIESQSLQSQLKGQVLWIDEAGQLGARTMRQVLAIAKEQDARVILTGDTRQHAAVERGDALRLLEHAAGIRPAEVRTIRRQSGAYKEAIEQMVEGNIVAGFDKLDQMGAVIECDEATRHQELAAAYVGAINEGASVLVVSPTHAEGASVTEAIRDALKDHGTLRRDERSTTRLITTDLSEAQRTDPVNYREGQVVGFHQNVAKKDGGFKKGEKCAVVGVDRGSEGASPRITVRRESGETLTLPLHRAGRYQVYEAETIGLAVGDKVRFTKNGMTADGKHRLANGNTYGLKGFTKDGDLILDNGWTVSRDHGYLNHGYCTTSHASQGKTVDKVLGALGTQSVGAISKQLFYVASSRARYEVRLFTDNKEELRDAVQRDEQRLSTLELKAGKAFGTSPSKKFARKKARLSRYARLKADVGREERTRERPRVQAITRGIGRER